MDYQFGISYFSILATDKQRAEILDVCDKWKTIVDKVREYKVYEDDTVSYYFILLYISDSHRNGKELCDFVIKFFPFIAIRQEESTYIIANNKDDFKDALNKIYQTKDNKIYFLYDMLTLNERYAIIKNATDTEYSLEGLQFTYTNDKGNVYQLDLNPDSLLIYRDDSEFEITDIFTGEVINIDIVDFIEDYFVFHIAIFNDKILKKTR